MPTYEYLFVILNYIEELPEIPITYLKIIISLHTIKHSDRDSLENSLEQLETEFDRFTEAITLLCILGFIHFNDGKIHITDIGTQIKYKNLDPSGKTDLKKSIYINPDFTMIIPIDDIASNDLYIILSHTDILKQDVIFHGQISKSSIVRARKRGMTLKQFLDTLQNNAKNELPQNMNFLLREWSEQTIDLLISNAMILKTTHPSFIDEIEVGKLKESIIERISDHYALIKKESIDDIIKLGNKKDAVITLTSLIDEGD